MIGVPNGNTQIGNIQIGLKISHKTVTWENVEEIKIEKVTLLLITKDKLHLPSFHREQNSVFQ